MRRTIEQTVENPLAAMLARAEIKSGDRVEISLLNQKIMFSVTRKEIGG
jgi:ATP-dependent Clp protease ATP-binding subunit ClpA